MEKIIFWSYFIGLVVFICSGAFVLGSRDRIALFLCGLASGLWVLPFYAFAIRLNEIKNGVIHVDASKFEIGAGIIMGHLLIGSVVIIVVFVLSIIRYYKSIGGKNEETKTD